MDRTSTSNGMPDLAQRGGGGSSGTDTMEQARDEARGVAEEGKEQVRHLTDEARHLVRERVDERSGQLARSLTGIGEDLEAMAGAADSDGPLPGAARQLASVAKRSADRLDREGPEGMLDDVRQFARRRPGIFLGAAFGVGIIAGRLLRADVDEHRNGSSEPQSDESSSSRPQPVYAGAIPGVSEGVGDGSAFGAGPPPAAPVTPPRDVGSGYAGPGGAYR